MFILRKTMENEVKSQQYLQYLCRRALKVEKSNQNIRNILSVRLIDNLTIIMVELQQNYPKFIANNWEKFLEEEKTKILQLLLKMNELSIDIMYITNDLNVQIHNEKIFNFRMYDREFEEIYPNQHLKEENEEGYFFQPHRPQYGEEFEIFVIKKMEQHIKTLNYNYPIKLEELKNYTQKLEKILKNYSFQFQMCDT